MLLLASPVTERARAVVGSMPAFDNMKRRCENADWRYAVGLPGRLIATRRAVRPRVAARSPMDDASLPAMKADE